MTTASTSDAILLILIVFFGWTFEGTCEAWIIHSNYHVQIKQVYRLNVINSDQTSDPADGSTTKGRSALPPLPDPTTNPDDAFFRSFRQQVPTQFQHWMRDSGIIRTLMDSLVWFGAPGLLEQHPCALGDFLRLTGQTSLLDLLPASWTRATQLQHSNSLNVTKLPYGSDSRQFISMIRQQRSDHETNAQNRRTIIFVHGGAWGSGFPEMYSLISTCFLNAGFDTVAMAGYRTFPSANVEGQMEDISNALDRILEEIPCTKNITLLAHSSGAHITLLGFLQNRFSAEALACIDQFLPMAGVYDIPNHYKFERGRGVERISPLAGVCGYTLGSFKENSPTRFVRRQVPPFVFKLPVRTLFLHGGMDTVVPYKSTLDFFEVAAAVVSEKISYRILESVGHADFVIHLMFGGEARDVVLDWILHPLEETIDSVPSSNIKQR